MSEINGRANVRSRPIVRSERANNVFIVVPKRGKHPYGDGFVQLNQLAIEKLVDDKTIGMEATRLFWLILSTVDYDNRIEWDAAHMADRLGIQLSAVYRALRVLRDRGLIETHPKHAKRLLLNKTVAWKGSSKALHEALDTAA
jgi:DNA-binding transcriptional ArsR family regulator